MLYSDVKAAETKLENVKNSYGEDSKQFKSCKEDYDQIILAWEATPEGYKIMDWAEPTETQPVVLEASSFEDGRAYFHDKGVFTPLDQVLVPTEEKGLVPIFTYPNDDTRYMENTFKG